MRTREDGPREFPQCLYRLSQGHLQRIRTSASHARCIIISLLVTIARMRCVNHNYMAGVSVECTKMIATTRQCMWVLCTNLYAHVSQHDGQLWWHRGYEMRFPHSDPTHTHTPNTRSRIPVINDSRIEGAVRGGTVFITHSRTDDHLLPTKQRFDEMLHMPRAHACQLVIKWPHVCARLLLI